MEHFASGYNRGKAGKRPGDSPGTLSRFYRPEHTFPELHPQVEYATDDLVMGLLSKAKDRVVEQMALSYLNANLLAPYGRATKLKIDSEKKAIQVEVELKGESTPVQIELIDYEIIHEDDHYLAKVKQIRTSREWLTTLAETQLRNGPLEIPSKVGRLLMRAL